MRDTICAILKKDAKKEEKQAIHAQSLHEYLFNFSSPLLEALDLFVSCKSKPLTASSEKCH